MQDQRADSNASQSYQVMLAQLNSLLVSIENDDTNIDEISSRLDLAYELLEKLKGRLTSAEARVEEIINARIGRAVTSDTTIIE